MIFGKTVMMNLLLSLLLGNFEICSLITRFKEEDK